MRRSPRRNSRRVRAHYSWARLGLGRRRERRLRVGRDERREAEGYEMRFSGGNGNRSAKRNNGGLGGGAKRRIGGRGRGGWRRDDPPRPGGSHLVVGNLWPCALGVATPKRAG